MRSVIRNLPEQRLHVGCLRCLVRRKGKEITILAFFDAKRNMNVQFHCFLTHSTRRSFPKNIPDTAITDAAFSDLFL